MTEVAVPGNSLHERAVRVAGLFAEQGVQHLELRHGDRVVRALPARVTDLPGLLVSLAPGDAVVCETLGVSVRRGGDYLYMSVAGSGSGVDVARLLAG